MKKEKLLLAASSAAAGFLSGLVGAGGGIVLYFALSALGENDAKENLVLTSASVMFFALASLFVYKDAARIDLYEILRISLPALLGGAFGALLMRKIPRAKLKKLFALIILISGVVMLLK